jgi:hypothetical protein
MIFHSCQDINRLLGFLGPRLAPFRIELSAELEHDPFLCFLAESDLTEPAILVLRIDAPAVPVRLFLRFGPEEPISETGYMQKVWDRIMREVMSSIDRDVKRKR